MSIASPVATGGGGEKFEQQVAGFALGLLLVRATPPILKDTSVVEVHLQTRHLGWRTDDILLVGEKSDGSHRKLALQVKLGFTVSASDKDCRETFEGMWEDYLASDRFGASTDRLAIVTLHGTSTLLRDFSSLLLCARAAADAGDFSRRLSLDGYVSKRAKQQNAAILRILSEYSGRAVEAESYWRFLRIVSVVSFDLNTPTAQTEANMLSLLTLCSVNTANSQAVARDTWARLVECAGHGNPVAKSYRQEDLPDDLLQRHASVSNAQGREISALIDHGRPVRNNIRSSIGEGYVIDRYSSVVSLFEMLAEHQVVVVTGVAGSGKSVLAKELLDELEKDYPVFAFQAVEFATAHIDETLRNAQSSQNANGLFALLSGNDKKIILIESVERLLEHSVRDAFAHLLNIVSANGSIRLVITVRDYSLESVRSAFLGRANCSHVVYEVPGLSDDELDVIQADVPGLALPLLDHQLRTFLRTPYVLDMASRLEWSETSYPTNAKEFRDKCWRELVRVDQYIADGMPDRREKTFLDVAYKRATQLRPFVRPETVDNAALEALCADSVLARASESSPFVAAAHDVMEDWGILRWFDVQFANTEGAVCEMAMAVGGFPAIRRGFRRWLGERFEINALGTRDFVLRAAMDEQLPAHFRDDCLVAALFSKTASEFLEACRPTLAEDDFDLLRRIIHTLRVACKKSPRWLDVRGLPSQMLVPAGAGWKPTLEAVLDLIEGLLPKHAALVLGLVEDWVKQIDWRSPNPEGSSEAGLIVETLLPLFNEYRFDAERKRALDVVIKIPQAVPSLQEMIERAKTRNHEDYLASDIVEKVLGGPSGSLVCREFPGEVMALVNARFRMSERDIEPGQSSLYAGELDVDEYFGIRGMMKPSFFPASALQGPFSALLRWHYREGPAFVIDLLNHAGDWYGEGKWPMGALEPASKIKLEVPGQGSVEQWINKRLFGQYRGTEVGSDLIQSASMALESWLLWMGEYDSIDLEAWLLYVLRKSTNVMATSVVASVCVAYPEKAGRAGLAVLSNREIVQCDRIRMTMERGAALGAFFGLNPQHRIYEDERNKSNSLDHRQQDLEYLAIKLQLTELREEVWAIIDRHRAEISLDDGQDSRVWRLALHRMDVRRFTVQEPPEEVDDSANEQAADRVYFGPGEIEHDVQEMVDESKESLANINRYLRVQNSAQKAWESPKSDETLEGRSELLSEAQDIQQELDQAEDFCRDGPGLVAALCVRDHLDELDNDELRWCVRTIEFEVCRDADSRDLSILHGRGRLSADRACASVVCLLAVDARSATIVDVSALLALALTHPVGEVAECANKGLGLFLTQEHGGLVLKCAAAAAYRARLISTLREEQKRLPFDEQLYGMDLADRATPAVRAAIENGTVDVAVELASLDFDDLASGPATQTILGILEHHRGLEESRLFYTRIAGWLAESKARERRSHLDHMPPQYEVEIVALHSVAGFALGLPPQEATRICEPLLRCALDEPDEAAKFLRELILGADQNESDCFWDLWQEIVNTVFGAGWIDRLDGRRHSGASLIELIFLGIHWKEDVTQWHRLGGNAHRLDETVQRLPAVTACVSAYLEFLRQIGQESLPESFKIISALLERGEAVHITSNSTVAFNLETMLSPFVYSEPHRVKSEPALRNPILHILDMLVAGGSSSAYRMRDDFVTPSAPTLE